MRIERSKTVTIADVARAAQVSTATVSLPYAEDLMPTADHGRRLAAGHQFGLKRRQLPTDGVTAAFVSNDLLAIGIHRGLADAEARERVLPMQLVVRESSGRPV